MSTTILRIIFAAVFATTGFLLGQELYTHLIALHVANQLWPIVLKIVVPIIGAIIGAFLAPLAQTFFETQLSEVEELMERLAPGQLVGGAVGLIAGLIIAFLVKSVLAEFATNTGRAGGYVANVLYILFSIFAAYLGARVGSKQSIPQLAGGEAGTSGAAAIPKVIDTSVIVDGRILEIVQSGFLEGPLVLPRFVLRELQLIADSLDAMKRTRGRRGLEILAKLQEATPLEIAERDYDDVGGAVDAKLVRLARERPRNLRRRSGSSRARSWPSNITRPESFAFFGSSCRTARDSMVLPQPDSPTMPSVRPAPILRST